MLSHFKEKITKKFIKSKATKKILIKSKKTKQNMIFYSLYTLT